jgi:hydrogenase expression/formation protein HypC
MCLAVPGRVTWTSNEDAFGIRTGKVDFSGIQKDVCLVYTPEVRVGDYVLVHVGFSISRIDEDEAQKVFAALKEWDLLEEELRPDNDNQELPA